MELMVSCSSLIKLNYLSPCLKGLETWSCLSITSVSLFCSSCVWLFCDAKVHVAVIFVFTDYYTFWYITWDYRDLISSNGRSAHALVTLQILLQRWTNGALNGKNCLDIVFTGENTSPAEGHFQVSGIIHIEVVRIFRIRLDFLD